MKDINSVPNYQVEQILNQLCNDLKYYVADSIDFI